MKKIKIYLPVLLFVAVAILQSGCKKIEEPAEQQPRRNAGQGATAAQRPAMRGHVRARPVHEPDDGPLVLG